MSAVITELWRHPVKSLQGERIEQADIDGDGLRGDRGWGVRDNATGKILTARREPRLLLAAARYLDDDGPEITLPNGERVLGVGPSTDAALSAWLERPVSLVAAAESGPATAEFFDDPTDDSSAAITWTMPTGRFVDALPLLLLTTASLRAGEALHPTGEWDVRRFRPNLLIDLGPDSTGWIEDDWCGQTVRAGTAVLAPRQPCVRCTMVVRPQPGLERDTEVYKTLSRHHHGTFGVWTEVDTPGRVQIGDTVTVS